MRTFPDARSLDALRARGARYAVVHGERLPSEEYQRLIRAIDECRCALTLVTRCPGKGGKSAFIGFGDGRADGIWDLGFGIGGIGGLGLGILGHEFQIPNPVHIPVAQQDPQGVPMKRPTKSTAQSEGFLACCCGRRYRGGRSSNRRGWRRHGSAGRVSKHREHQEKDQGRTEGRDRRASPRSSPRRRCDSMPPTSSHRASAASMDGFGVDPGGLDVQGSAIVRQYVDAAAGKQRSDVLGRQR